MDMSLHWQGPDYRKARRALWTSDCLPTTPTANTKDIVEAIYEPWNHVIFGTAFETLLKNGNDIYVLARPLDSVRDNNFHRDLVRIVGKESVIKNPGEPVDVRAVVIFNTGIFEHDTEAQHRAGLTKEAMKSKIKSALEADATRDGFGHVRHVHLIYEHRPVEHDLRL